MSDRVERKLLSMLADPRESPYGNPIPGLAEIGGEAAGTFRDGVVPLPVAVSTPADGGASRDLVVRRLGEPVQTDPQVMNDLARAGLRPGARVSASRSGDTLRVRTDGGDVVLPLPVALHVFVAEVAAP
jgi:DtxR family Mn-dependent transcriptional regulator